MTKEVINTVEVQAFAGRSEELGKQLKRIVETLRSKPGCESYMVDRCPDDSNRWTVSARWQSEDAMRNHFNCPEVQDFIGLLDSHLASGVHFNS